MFDKWKVTIAGLMVGVVLGWAAWSFTRKNAEPTIDEAKMSAALQAMPNPTAHLIGKPLPSWSFPANAWANTSKPVSLESLRGSVTLVEVFRINCSSCQQAAPFMGAMQKNFIPKGLKIVGIQAPIARNPDENDWKKVQYVTKDLWKLTYPMAFDAKSQYLQKLYKNNRDEMRWPTLLLLDRNGIVVYGHTGHREDLEMRLYEEIQRQLAKK